MILIDCKSKWWKLWSVRIHAAMSAAIGYLIASPDAMAGAINALPASMQAAMPPAVAFILFGLGTFGRLVHQPKVTANANP